MLHAKSNQGKRNDAPSSAFRITRVNAVVARSRIVEAFSTYGHRLAINGKNLWWGDWRITITCDTHDEIQIETCREPTGNGFILFLPSEEYRQHLSNVAEAIINNRPPKIDGVELEWGESWSCWRGSTKLTREREGACK